MSCGLKRDVGLAHCVNCSNVITINYTRTVQPNFIQIKSVNSLLIHDEQLSELICWYVPTSMWSFLSSSCLRHIIAEQKEGLQSYMSHSNIIKSTQIPELVERERERMKIVYLRATYIQCTHSCRHHSTLMLRTPELKKAGNSLSSFQIHIRWHSIHTLIV